MRDPAASVQAFLGFGGNLGDPAAAIAESLRALDSNEHIVVREVSSLYRTPPWGVAEQPDFLNAVAEIETDLSALALLGFCLETERQLKRVRRERWGPRIIDIDLLVYGDLMVDEDELQVPHPRMLQRAFVLAPLAEIAPALPIGGTTVVQHLAELDQQGITRLPVVRGWWKAPVSR